MKTHALIAIFAFLLVGLVKGQSAKQLEEAYKEESTTKLKSFFDEWSKSLPVASKKEREQMSKVVQEAYRVYEVFYNPFDLKNRGGSEFGNDIYKDFNYLIIQDKLKIYQKDKLYYTPEETKDYIVSQLTKQKKTEWQEKILAQIDSGKISTMIMENYGPDIRRYKDSLGVLIDSVTDFRPNIAQTKATPLFLNDNYRKLLDSFLGNVHHSLGTGGIMNPAVAKDESLKRQKFLQNYVKIFYGHWGGYWQYYSYPAVTSISFDKGGKYAMINYTMIYEGGVALLGLEEGSWKLISVKRTWIQ